MLDLQVRFCLLGERVVTRTVSFKPFCSREYHPVDSIEVTDSSFDRELCEWLTQQIPRIRSMPGKTGADKLEMYLMEFPGEFNEVVEKAYIFVKTENVTHYVSSISLGAAEYSVSTTTKTTVAVGARAKAEVGSHDVGVGAGVGAKRSKEKANTTSKDHRIGDIGIVERRKGEAVVGYEILPVYMLVRQEAVKKVLQTAIKFYLERESEYLVL